MKLLELIGFKKKEKEPVKPKLTLKAVAEKQWQLTEEMGLHNKSALEALALITAELGEAIQECNPEGNSTDLQTFLANVILKTMDFAIECNIDIAKTIEEKQACFEEFVTKHYCNK